MVYSSYNLREICYKKINLMIIINVESPSVLLVLDFTMHEGCPDVTVMDISYIAFLIT